MFDTTEIDKLAGDMEQAHKATLAGVKAATAKGAMNVKKGARQRVEGFTHLPLYPASIGYETTTNLYTVEAEIGPDKTKAQGALGNLIEYGSENNAPIPHLQPELDLEGPRYERAVYDAAEVC